MQKVLAINYTSEVDFLLQEEKLKVDYVKFPSLNGDMKVFKEIVDKGLSMLYHGLPPYGGNFSDKHYLDKVDWDYLNTLIYQSKTPYLSGHISVDVEQIEGCTLENQHLVDTQEIIDKTVDNVLLVQEKTGKAVILENTVSLPYIHTRAIKCVTNPEVITQICENANIGFLLDTAHAKVEAWQRGMTFEQYLFKLPLHRLKEIHLSGVIFKDNIVKERHCKLNIDDYLILEYLLKNYTTIDTVTLEFGPQSGGITTPAVQGVINTELVEQTLEQYNNIKDMLDRL